jgi:MFS family permease
MPPAPESATTPADAAARSAFGATLPITLLVQAAASAATIAPAVAAPELLPALGFGPVAVGIYIATVYCAAMFSSQWGAAFVQRWGPIRTSQVALGCGAIGVMLVGVPQPAVALLGAVFIGIGYGPITPASSQMLARTTPPERYALVFSLKQTGVPVGGAIAGLLVPFGLAWGGVWMALGQVALLCVVSALLAEMLRGVLDTLRNARGGLPGLAQLLRPMRFVLAHPVLRQIAFCSLVFSAVQVCLTTYLVSFLTGDLGWSLVAAGAALSVAQGGGVVGRVLWGVVADRFDPRSTLLGLGLAMALAGVATSLLQPDTPSLWVTLLLIAYGSTAVGWNGVYLATVAKKVPHEQAAIATAGSLFFTYFGVVVGPPLFGALGGAFGGLGVSFALLVVPLAWCVWALARGDWAAVR